MNDKIARLLVAVEWGPARVLLFQSVAKGCEGGPSTNIWPDPRELLYSRDGCWYLTSYMLGVHPYNPILASLTSYTNSRISLVY